MLLSSPSVYSHSFSSDPAVVNNRNRLCRTIRLPPFMSWLFLLTLSREGDLHSIYLSILLSLPFFFPLKREPAFVIILGQ